MDSGGATIPRQRVGVLTVLSALVLAASAGLLAALALSGPALGDLAAAPRALALIVGRTLDLDDAIERAPGWEGRLYRVVLGERERDLAEAITSYEELAAAAPSEEVELIRAVLYAEAGRVEDARSVAADLLRDCVQVEPCPARLIGAAYFEGPAKAVDARLLDDSGAPFWTGWFRDRLAMRWAERTGEEALGAAAQAALEARGQRLLGRVRALAVVDVLLALVGAGALAVLARRGGTRVGRPAGAGLPPPWSGAAGAAVLLQGGAAGAGLVVLVLVSGLGDHEGTMADLAAQATMTLALVPLLVLARVRLLEPLGLGIRRGFGLVPVGGSWRATLLASVVVLGIGRLGELALAVMARLAELSAHWSEWFDPTLAWGSTGGVALTLGDTVVLTPLLEEIAFRGLLFATLRRGLGVAGAAGASAVIFAGAHGYGATGFLTVLWSGLVWAWAYERTGSVIPGIVAHACDNLSASLTALVVLRG